MNRNQLIVRGVLVVLIGGVLWIGYSQYARTRPDYHWNLGQTALAEEDLSRARIHFENLLQRFPEHAEGHRELAGVMLTLAQKENGSTTIAGHREALAHLAEAARLLPNDKDLQVRVMAAHMANEQFAEAARVAERLVVLDADNAEAVYALAWRDVANRKIERAKDRFEQLRNLPSRRVFQALLLRYKMHTDAEDEDAAQSVLAEASRLANKLTLDQFRLLSPRDRTTMQMLLVAGVENSNTPGQALARCENALAACEKLRAADLIEAEDAASSAANAIAMTQAKLAGSEATSTQAAKFESLQSQAEALCQPAFESGVEDPLVFQVLATRAFEAKDTNRAKEILAAADKQLASSTVETGGAQAALHLMAARQLVVAGDYAGAEPYINTLLQTSEMEGWGHLLAGARHLDLANNETAIDHFTHAKRLLGHTPLVQMGLANAYLASAQWKLALSELQGLSQRLETLNKEEQAWAAQLVGTRNHVEMARFKANLALGQWDESQKHLKALAKTPFEVEAWTLAISFLWTHEHRAEAMALIGDVRKRFPRSSRLLSLHVSLLQHAKRAPDQIAKLFDDYLSETPDDLKAQLMRASWLIDNYKADQAEEYLAGLPPAIYSEPNELAAVATLRAKALLILGEPEKALKVVEPLREFEDTSRAAAVVAASSAVSQDDLDRATKELQKLDASSGSKEDAAIRFLRGELEARQGNYEEAIDQMADSLQVGQLRSQAEAALIRSILALAEKESPAVAEAKCRELLKKNPDDAVLLMTRAGLIFQQGELDLGVQQLREVARLHPESPTPHTLLAKAYLEFGDFKRAQAAVKTAIALRSDHLPTFEIAIKIAMQQRQFQNAIQLADAALEVQPNLWQFAIYKADAHVQLEQHEQAEAVLRDVLKQHPRIPSSFLNLAKLLIDRERIGEALTTLQAGRTQLPEYAFEFVIAEADLLARVDHVKEANELAEEFVKERDGNKSHMIAEMFYKAGALESSADWAQRAYEYVSKEQQLALRTMMGDIALQQSADDPAMLQKAEQHYREVLNLQSDNLVAANNLATLLAGPLKRPKDALAVIDSVRGDRNADKLPAPLNLTWALSHQKLGDADQAIAILEQGASAQPKEGRLKFELAKLLNDQKKTTLALANLKEAVDLGLSNPFEEQALEMIKKLEASN